MAGLKEFKWKTCTCEFQADTCLADKSCTNPEAAIVAGDSDLLVYEHVQELTMPVWQNRQKMYKTFSKGAVLQSLGLNSSRQLLLAAIVSSNDYFVGFKGIPFKDAVNIVKNIKLDCSGAKASKEGIQDGIREFVISANKSRKAPLVVPDGCFDHALSAFIDLVEHAGQSGQEATASFSTHAQVKTLVERVIDYRSKESDPNPHQFQIHRWNRSFWKNRLAQRERKGTNVLSSVNDSKGRRYSSHYTDLNRLKPAKDSQLKGLEPSRNPMPPASSIPPLSQPTITEPATNVNHGELNDHSLLDLQGQSALHAHQAQDNGRHPRRKRGQKAESQRRRRQLRRRVEREERRAREDEIKALNVAIQLGQVDSISDHIGEHDWTPQDSSSEAATPVAGAATRTSNDKGKKRKMEVEETLPTFPASLDTSSGSSSSPGHHIVMPRKKSKHMEAAASSSNPLSLGDDISSADWKSANMESSTQAESSTTAKHLKGDVMQKQFRRAFHPVSMIAGTIEECLFRSTKMTKQENKTIAQAINNNVNYMNDVRMFGFMALHLLIMSEVSHVTQDTQDDEFSTDGEDDQQHLHPLNLLLHT
ncbi:hypothetical protein BG000_005637, partial [Podila horticola]